MYQVWSKSVEGRGVYLERSFMLSHVSHNYVAAARYLCGGRQIYIWRPPDNLLGTSAKKKS